MQVVARFNGGRFAEAEEAAKILASGPDAERFPQIYHLLGMIRTKRGDFPKAATAYRSFLVAQPGSPVASQLRKKMVEWKALGVIPK
jgi:Flp pilus assembly protein TadD